MRRKTLGLLIIPTILTIAIGMLVLGMYIGSRIKEPKEDSAEFYKISPSDGLYVNSTLGDFDGDGKSDYAILYINPTTNKIRHVSSQSAFIAVFKEGGKLLGSIKDIAINYGISVGTIAPISLSDLDKKQYLSFIFSQGAHGYGLNIYSFNEDKSAEVSCQYEDKLSPCSFGGDGGYPPLYQVIGNFDKNGSVEVIDWFRDWPYYQRHEKVHYLADRIWRWDRDKFIKVSENDYRKIRQEMELRINFEE